MRGIDGRKRRVDASTPSVDTRTRRMLLSSLSRNGAVLQHRGRNTLRRGRRRELRATDEDRGHTQVADRDEWSLPDADRLPVHEAEERQHRAHPAEGRGLHELTIDDEHRDRADAEPPENRAAPQDGKAL